MKIDYIGQLAIYACRYAQHRKTGAACQIANAILALKDDIADETNTLIIAETYEASACPEDWERLRRELDQQLK